MSTPTDDAVKRLKVAAGRKYISYDDIAIILAERDELRRLAVDAVEQTSGWKREADRLLRLAKDAQAKADDAEKWKDILRRIDKMYRCDHTSHGPEDAEAVVRHVRESLDEVESLRKWKKQQLAVESEWDVRAVGKLLNVPLGKSIRGAIQPGIERLLAWIEEAHHHDGCGVRNWPGRPAIVACTCGKAAISAALAAPAKPITPATAGEENEMNDTPKCEICGEPMPPGETMFNFHGYSGPCPKPPLPKSRPKYSFGGVEGNDLKSLAAEIIKDNDPRALRDVCDEISAQLSKIVPDAPVAPERPAVPRPKPYA